MATEIDEGKGLVKTYWQDIRDKVHQVEPKFAEIVDALSPDKSFPLYLAYYPYGATDADTESSLFPDGKGGYYRLSSNEAPKDVVKQLGYSVNYTPLGMVLDKELECFVDLKQQEITIPWHIFGPGDMFPLSRILNRKSDRIYSSNNLLSSTAGARSAFMLPNIGSATSHVYLQRDFNLRSRHPKSLYQHWHIFKELVNSEAIRSDWRCCVLYFSEKWINCIHSDKKWWPLKEYLNELILCRYGFNQQRISYDMVFSIIQKNCNLKSNPYLADTAKHLFATALGDAPGYVPALEENALPLHALQKAFVESYGLKKYLPTIMCPTHFKFESDTLPIYYSLQHPSTQVFSPKSTQATTIRELLELEQIMRIYIEELSKPNALCCDTIIGKMIKMINFNFYHNKKDRNNIIKSSMEISKYDKRFYAINKKYTKPDAKFASDAPFVRGCIRISTKK